jgi:sugar lactone lactonase YvrE
MFFILRITKPVCLVVALGLSIASGALVRAVQLTVGANVKLSVTADGTPPFSYQWFKNSAVISGATSATYLISNAQLADAGDYSAVVSNNAGTTTAPSASLTVVSGTVSTNVTPQGPTDTTPQPAVPTAPVAPTTPNVVASLIAQPLSQLATLGHDAAFSVTGGGSGQWQVSSDGSSWSTLANSNQYSGVTTATLVINDVSSALDGFKYRFLTSAGTSNTVILGVTAAFFPFPVGIAADGSGNLYVGDTSTDTIQKISSTGAVSLVAGSAGQTGTADGNGSNARFNDPSGVFATSDGSLGVCDNANGTVRRISVDGTVTTLAGSTVSRGNVDGNGSAATFSSPTSLCQDATGNFYVSDALNNTVRKVTANGTVSTLAGSAGVAGNADGVGASARFNHPTGIAVDGAGNVYVADTTNNTVRKVSLSGTVSTIAGLPGVSGSQDGAGSEALFNNPGGLAADNYGNVYVADTGNSVIRKITSGGLVTTVAGLPGIAGLMDGVGSNAWFNQPKGIVLKSNGILYVADTGNAAIRQVTLDGSVTTLALSAGASVVSNQNNVPTTTQSVATSSTSAPGATASSGSSSSGGGGGTMGGETAGLLFVAYILRLFCIGKGSRRCESARRV